MARPAMNVVLATDGSAQAQIAEELVGAMRWPGGTRITVIQVHELMPAMHGIPADVWQAVYDTSRRWIDEHLEKVTAELSVTGREVAARSMTGRPASVIVDEARRIGADLIVVGSRGRGVVATTLLGSIAAEIIDHAPCPVLVARAPSVTRVVVAADGSDGSRQAQDVLAWPVFAGVPLHVVSVIDLAPFMAGGLDAAMIDPHTYQQMLDELRELHTGYARSVTERLAAGSTSEVREGFVSQEIVAAAAAAKADLIVVGSRGQTGLPRLLLGSVARGVLLSAPCSVLVARRASTQSSSS